MRPTPLTGQPDEPSFGGKAAQLALATRAGLSVPPGIALPVAFVDAVAAGDAQARAELDGVAGALRPPLVARSSAVGEDSEQASFAGQHLTRLNLRSPLELVDAVCAIWDSARSSAARAYRERLGVPGEPRIAVVVQELVEADSSGVLFSRNPVDESDELVIEAAWGLGEAVVAGLVTPDRFRVARDGTVLERAPGVKDVAVRVDAAGGTREAELAPELASTLCLDDSHLTALHALVLRCDDVFTGDHDIEWAVAGGRLYLLQRRALTTVAGASMEANA
jgi:pyruvate, water dikinase